MRSCAGVIEGMIQRGDSVVVCGAMEELGFSFAFEDSDSEEDD
jgi:hypothetical protein